MTDRIELEAGVPEEMHGERLDQVAARLFPDYSRSRLQTWIKKGELTADGMQRRFAIETFHIEGTKFDMACEWGNIHLQARSIRVLTE